MNERVVRLRPEALTSEQARVYEHITGGPRGQGPRVFDITDAQGVLLGPFNAMLFSPRVGDKLQALGAALRYESSLPDRVREAIILVVAAYHRSAFERHAHEAVGRQAGLTSQEIESLREESPAEVFTDAAEQAAVNAAHQLLTRGDCDDDCFAALIRQHGNAGVFEVATLVGYYSLLAMQLRLFRADEEPGSFV
jgi:4-carboxymuconolactone decarboxylase